MTSASDDRRQKALELHLAGATYDRIAEACGYASRSGAHKAVQEALKERGELVDAQVAETEIARLDAMLTGLWPKARRGDVQAVDRVLKIEERREHLLLAAKLGASSAAPAAGADAPKATPLDEVTARRAKKAAATPRRRRTPPKAK